MQGIYAQLTGGVHLPSVYMHCTRYSSWCSLIQGIHAWLTGGIICLLYICIVLDIVVDVPYSRHPCLIDWWFHLPSIYMHCTRSSSGCCIIQDIYAWLTGESIYLLYICIVLDIVVDVALYKASMPNWLGMFICLQYICIVLDVAVVVVVCKASVVKWLWDPSACYIYIYMYCTISSSGCSGMQCVYARLTGGFICLLYMCIVLDIVVDVALYKASMLNWLGVFICLQYICIVLDLAVGVVVCKASVLDWLEGSSSIKASMLDWLGVFICLQYICIVLDIVVDVALFKASMLDWLVVSSAFYIYALY